MRGRAAVFLALLAPVVAAQPATAKTVSGGTVAIGRGVAGIELGMTRAQVIGELGKPREQGERYMSYGPRRGADTTFDLYLEGVEGRPIRMIGFWGEKFLLRDGTKIFHRRGVIAKLKKQYGSRLKKVYQRRVDIRLYRIKSRFQGRRVWTDFNVDRFGSEARIGAVFILFPNWTG